ncbi:hypothetical protein [Porphyromonas cangingivalis]|uniref:hypothetical protein n=1 Tax=Porphyromonas cangingivalis TaxID=36874 RepID=UPI00051DEF92|nr:hypothetical protein [Porphyromonas cangingivalis]KGL48155.1 hypothetical protein HQ34_06500 [Porphyromonas cangingivalis]
MKEISKTLKRVKNHTPQYDIVVLFLLLLMHTLVVKVYRPYVYANCDVEDGLSFVNNYPSFSAVLVGYLAFKIYSSGDPEVYDIFGARWQYVLLATVVLGNYLHEGLDMILGGGDWYDMIAITLGGVFVLPFIYFKKDKYERIR